MKLTLEGLKDQAAWQEKGFVDQAFVDYASDETQVSFPWSIIDKITPWPLPAGAATCWAWTTRATPLNAPPILCLLCSPSSWPDPVRCGQR